MRALVDTATAALGRIDLYMANAGIDRTQPDSLQASDEDWARMVDTNVMSHVRAARRAGAAVAGRRERGRFVVTASAAGLLTMIGGAPYSVTKHAAVGFAEWLSVTYGAPRDGGPGASARRACRPGCWSRPGRSRTCSPATRR